MSKLEKPKTEDIQNARRFFANQIGDSFKFNIEFMAWMKAKTGKTLADACDKYHDMKAREADPNFRRKLNRTISSINILAIFSRIIQPLACMMFTAYRRLRLRCHLRRVAISMQRLT